MNHAVVRLSDDPATLLCYRFRMDHKDLIARIAACADALRLEGIEHLAIFGSRARGDARADSDLDIIVDISPNTRFSLLNLSGVALLIEDSTGLPTQVVLRRSAPPGFVERISDDLIPVF